MSWYVLYNRRTWAGADHFVLRLTVWYVCDNALQLGVMLAGSSTSVLDLTLPIVIGTQPLKQTLVPGLQSEYRQAYVLTSPHDPFIYRPTRRLTKF